MSRLNIFQANFSIDIRTIIEVLNDLWRYRVNDSTWTWISGSDTGYQLGVYGEKGVPNSDNNPGSRYGALALYDSCTHKLMLFGGLGYDEQYPGVSVIIDSISV